MFTNQYFYHSSVRKAITAFGTLFNGIQIQRKDSGGNIIQTLPVPIEYGPKQKFIQRIQAAPTLDTGRSTFEHILPMLGFEITGLTYDPDRTLQVIRKTRSIEPTNHTVKDTFVSTPYNLTISMSAWAKNQDDGLQIVEQILPYFCPDINVPVIDLPELNIERDLQIVLDNLEFQDDYMGNADQRVALHWNFQFTMKINLYGFVANTGLIREVIANVYAGFDNTRGEKIDITPNPSNVDPDDPYTYNTTFTEF